MQCAVLVRHPTETQIVEALQHARVNSASCNKQAFVFGAEGVGHVVRPANLGDTELLAAANEQRIDLSALEEAVVLEGYFLPRRCAGVPQYVVELSADINNSAKDEHDEDDDDFAKANRGTSFLFELFLADPSHWLVQQVDNILHDDDDDDDNELAW